MNENVNDQDVLLVADKKDNKLKVVEGMGEDGKLKTLSSNKKNEAMFMKLDKQGNVLDNFFSNFHRQYKDPTHFQFFKVPANLVENLSAVLQEMLQHPYVPYNKETLDMHRVSSDEISTKQTYQPIDENRIDWNQLEKLGVTRETLEATGSLDAMLNWGKSPVLIPITPKFDDVTKVRKPISKFGKPLEGWRSRLDFSEAHSTVGEANFKSRKAISKFGKPLKS